MLDVGCDAGVTTRAIARRVGPAGRVVGVDISASLIDRAREGARATDAPVAFLLADAGRADFTPAGFDLIFSRFGTMFFDDPVAAFGHLRRALTPGGRLAFVCWRGAAENDWVRLPMTAIRGIVPHRSRRQVGPLGLPMTAIRGIVPPSAPADPEAHGPFAFADRARVARIPTAAGYDGIGFEAVDRQIRFGVGATREAAIDDAVDHARQVGPLGRALGDQPDAVRARAIAAVRAAFARHAGPDGVTIGGAAWIVTARPG